MANKIVTVRCSDTRRRFYLKLSLYPSGLQLPTDKDILLTSAEWKQLKEEKVNNVLLFEEKQIIDDIIEEVKPDNNGKIEVE